MSRITVVEVSDVRFPTSLSMDGSDAMNKDGDYSATYVAIRTEDPDVNGYGFTFTIGRGNDVCALATAAPRRAARRPRGRRGRRRPRRHLPGPARPTPSCGGSGPTRASSTSLWPRS